MPRAGLDPDIVARRAIEIIDARGVEALTLAGVAADLGVATPSLYKHVGGLDDLVDRVAAIVTAELASGIGDATRGRSGRDALEALAAAYRRFALEHPGTYPLSQRHRDSQRWTTSAAAALAAVIDALRAYGVTGDDVDRIRFVRAALHGFVDLERGGGFGMPASVDASFAVLVGSLDATLRTAVDA
ncbi:TetR/AcrR family transcriptional regulator [Herbiconiux sp. L3-i23]|uniref:TetR/AcrR family transcriptional regulator n=1 Tax=Herbiconiux sp. L3-i23 TaxID=2905871 RepID=UPI00205F1BFA|nr:TetR/AcrR family transcriptional regulator [Herbiconiux sp. L3-i23]BDI21420.1 TetR family transcriptional regulator [Herbiconiux sp. L3-i23]